MCQDSEILRQFITINLIMFIRITFKILLDGLNDSPFKQILKARVNIGLLAVVARGVKKFLTPNSSAP